MTDKLDLHMRAYEVLHKPSLDAENAEIEHTKQLEQVGYDIRHIEPVLLYFTFM